MRANRGSPAEDVLAAVTTLSFDIAGLELFLPLHRRGRIELVTRTAANRRGACAGVLDACNATRDAGDARDVAIADRCGLGGLARCSKALCGGEAFSRDLANALLDIAGRAVEHVRADRDHDLVDGRRIGGWHWTSHDWPANCQYCRSTFSMKPASAPPSAPQAKFGSVDMVWQPDITVTRN